MPKLKTHKGMKKRFKVSATGKVSHKRCGSSHLMSHKSGKQVRRLRKKSTLKVTAEARRIRFALLERQNVNPEDVEAHKLAALHPHPAEPGADRLRRPTRPSRNPEQSRGGRSRRQLPVEPAATVDESRTDSTSWRCRRRTP